MHRVSLIRLLLVTSALASSASFWPLHAREEFSAGETLKKYCFDCHDSDVQKGDLNLQALEGFQIAKDSSTWEKVVRKLNARQMQPIGKKRPDEATYDKTIEELTATLDKAAADSPNPGRSETFRRLNRTEYQNAIRDLLNVEIDPAALLPKDEASHGFDNVTVGTLSPTLLDRYITAAQKISQLAIGAPRKKPGGDTYRIPPDVTKEDQVEGSGIVTRGRT